MNDSPPDAEDLGGLLSSLGAALEADSAQAACMGAARLAATSLDADAAAFFLVRGSEILEAFSPGPEPFIKRLHERVEHDYRRLPYPISSDLFLVTRDGVAGTRPETKSEAA